jgi:large subunit ribosomal protein L10
MQRHEKEQVVERLTERLKESQALIVADYRGLTMTQIDGLRGELLQHGARFSVVKNTLTRRAAEAAGADTLLALLDGPTAIAFLDAEGDPVAVAKALSRVARETKVLAVKGGVLEGKSITAADVEELSKLPAVDVLRAQVLAAIAAPLTTIVGLFAAPLQNLVGLIDARIDQLRAEGAEVPEPEEDTAAVAEPVEEPAAEAAAEESAAEAPADEPVAEGDQPQTDESANDGTTTTEETREEEE